MEELLNEWISGLNGFLLGGIIVICLGLLGRAADWLVNEAVKLSEYSGIPKIVVGATVVSLGTTTPEAVVSVLAAVQGRPGLALGNAVGSIICDTGLILGLACLISPLRLDPRLTNRQGWIQFGSGILLVVSCLPWTNLGSAFTDGGNLPRWLGFLFVALLIGYLWLSVHWSKEGLTIGSEETLADSANSNEPVSIPKTVIKILGAISLIVGASWILIPSVGEAATRMHVPESIIAATMVAFGTSLPELVTAVTAARKGHGEIAVGNVIGADILNVLFVAGVSAAATSGGLDAPSHFFTLYFPSMLIVLTVFRLGIFTSKDHLRRPFGFLLLATYLAVTIASYVFK
jgi:cation:H+ antiporter